MVPALDPGLQEALVDRLSFRRFCGFGLEEGTPDETTLCRFRIALAERGLTAVLFAELSHQFDAKRPVLKAGTLIDATLVEADADVRKGQDGKAVTVERKAGFAHRRGRAFFGFKAHVAVDAGSGLVRRAVLTPADVNESQVADRLIIGDKAYDSAERRAMLPHAVLATGSCDVTIEPARSAPTTSSATSAWSRSAAPSSASSAP